MPNFIVLDDNNVVENVIVAESLQDAEINTNKTCFEYLESYTAIIINRTLWDGNEFVTPEII
jgi:hypothetical protein